jgi:pimeloyl-ACP methyl ester carboxylesterase
MKTAMTRNVDTSSRVGGAGLSRRQLLTGAAAAAAGTFAASTAAAGALHRWDPTRVRLTLPVPTGPHPVGTVSLHLIDRDRQDPWLSTPKPRELMVSIWYPARHAGHWRLAPWLSRAAAEPYREFEEARFDVVFGDVSLDGVEYPITHGRLSAPVLRQERPYPVVLYSPSGAGIRALGTTQVEDLASHGYIVVTIDHTYDAIAVEFPKGRVELNPAPPVRPGPPPAGDLATYLKVALHRGDARFVLDKLAEIAGGANPDAEHRALPAGLRGSLDMERIGIFGHSFGGCTTAHTFADDQRVVAGLVLDGSIVPDVPMNPPSPGGPGGPNEHLVALARRIGNRPFLFISSGGRGPEQLGPLVYDVWNNLIGWRRFLTLIGSAHGTFVDALILNQQLVDAGILPPGSVPGTIDLDRAVIALRAYIRAFFDLWLRESDTQLLEGPSPDYPEVAFMAY